ncbi:hypothetical protein C1I89_05995 [Achromobacter pulmonis]|uniref:Uncharacterized protein n=1 Tax=Achromobacter pulmonis TaxID=1389932 RepID=A0A2N8KK51_9BURK|nr:hypothetical protein [Achromobacter pulmonis]PND33815.1 hypothetical protein C1I89_05995 [Achromobacter pulmonis]
MADTEADYLLHQDGHIRPNALCEGVEQRYRAAKTERDRMWRGHAALLLAQAFRTHPWLAAFRLCITVSFEYDDSGGYYRTMYLSAEAAERSPSGPLPGDEFPDGEWNSDQAQVLVESMLEDDCYDIYEALASDPASNDDLTLHLERARIAPLLDREHVSGEAILAALLPELDPGSQQAPSV